MLGVMGLRTADQGNHQGLRVKGLGLKGLGIFTPWWGMAWKRTWEMKWKLEHLGMCVYIHTYICICIYIYIHIGFGDIILQEKGSYPIIGRQGLRFRVHTSIHSSISC